MSDSRSAGDGSSDLTPIGEEVVATYPGVDVTDDLQSDARSALGGVVTALLDDLGEAYHATVPSPANRVALQYASIALQLLSDSHSSLRPGATTFLRAHMVSNVIRSLVELHARQLSIRRAEDPDARARSLLAESLRTELLAMRLADSMANTSGDDTARLEAIQLALGDAPYQLNVVDELSTARRDDLIVAYRWESAHVHSGAAVLAARARLLAVADMTVDVSMNPLSLWRVAQLTWCSYGVALQLIDALVRRLSVGLGRTVAADTRARGTIRAAAERARGDGEPVSPAYHRFDFPFPP